ncbi:phosphoribosylaminoimidazolesuccinocarboxamide synthase [Candidatus Woesearchaeota archaeon]|nr:phosphoribosylaminoimidazolesuccinocarboxamide synthase [Candidatus Woesearchaeota archaeon]
MTNREILHKQLSHTLKETNFPQLGQRYVGKVRDNYTLGKKRVIITTDRLSAFDKVLTTIPFKGQVLNQLAAFWFEQTKQIIPNHVITIPDPNVMVVKECSVFPIEMVVRGYLAGSAWRDYQAGKDISGIKLSKGMKMSQKFPTPLLTPSTKAATGHDEHISREEILRQKLVDPKLYEQMERIALALFKKGTEVVAKQGLILVDTKYEFGLLDGKLVLADEIHTPDSSRFWYADTYEDLFKAGKDQRMLDKEFLRQWLIREKKYMGDGPLPNIPDDIRVEVAWRYIKAYEEITGTLFKAVVGDPLQRIEQNLKGMH